MSALWADFRTTPLRWALMQRAEAEGIDGERSFESEIRTVKPESGFIATWVFYLSLG